MLHKFSKLLLVALLAVPLQHMNGKDKTKKLCSLLVKKCLFVQGNEVINGTLTVGGANFNNLITLVNAIAGTTTITGLGTLVSSIIPYSSGLLTVGVNTPATIPTTGLVMAFGSSNITGIAAVDPTLTVTETGYAFTVPRAGTLHNLQVSVDSAYVTSLGATPFTFTFTLLRSPCTSGVLTDYTSTGLSATATTTAPTSGLVGPIAGGAGCGSNAGSITVAQGDRIVMLVTPSAPVSDVVLALLSLSAGVLYSPA